MKKLISLIVLLPIFFGCNTNKVEGNLVGVPKRNQSSSDMFGGSNSGALPFGMAYIQSGSYQAGGNAEDIMGSDNSKTKSVSIPAFYMDETEISNNEYRQFVYWVRDSIAREKLYRRNVGIQASKWINKPDNFFKEPYRTLIDMGSDVQGGNSPFQLLMDSTNNSNVDKLLGGLILGSDVGNIQLINGYTSKSPSSKTKNNNGSQKPQDVNDKNQLTLTNDEFLFILNYYSSSKNSSKKNSSGQPQPPAEGGRIENRKYFTLNWVEPIKYEDAKTSFLLSDMYYSKSEQFNNRKEIDTRLLFFDYYWVDFKEAAKRGKVLTKSLDARKNFHYDSLSFNREGGIYKKSRREPLGKDYKSSDSHRSTLFTDIGGNKVWVDTTVYGKGKQFGETQEGVIDSKYSINDTNSLYGTVLENPGQDLDLGFTNSKGQHNAIRGHTDRSRFIVKERINVYPDTLCWIRDFTYSDNEAMCQNYFSNTAYDHYPVVGVTWSQAKAFSVWRTQIYNTWLQNNGDMFVNDFRLPTESQWERAARGDLQMVDYPWGGPYIRNAAGCFQANFKPLRGRYFEDGGFYTVKVYSYEPNEFGLYCMSGNVAEWCSTAYSDVFYDFAHDMSSEYDYQAKDGEAPAYKKKVIRGGSWKDIGYYLLNGTRTYEYQDSAKSFIGFRNSMIHLGRGGDNINKENGEEIQSDIQLK